MCVCVCVCVRKALLWFLQRVDNPEPDIHLDTFVIQHMLSEHFRSKELNSTWTLHTHGKLVDFLKNVH